MLSAPGLTGSSPGVQRDLVPPLPVSTFVSAVVDKEAVVKNRGCL